MKAPLMEFDDKEQARFAKEMDEEGFTTVNGFMDGEALTRLQRYIAAESIKHGGNYFCYQGDALYGTFIGSLAATPEFGSLLSGIYRYGAKSPSQSARVLPVIRCVHGSTGLRESHAFHYDATLVTALLPIEIPQGTENCGDLILFRNLRRVRTSVLINVLEKALLQNAFSRKVLLLGIRLGLLKPMRLKLVPGNLYIFWGYRSLHANEPCDPAHRRATALFHFGDPHAGKLLTRLILALNQQRARRASRNSEQTAA